MTGASASHSPDSVPRAHIFVWIGVTLGLGWTLFLAGLGLFSDGSLDPQWPTALVFVLLAGAPAFIAMIGRNKRGALIAAAAISIPLSLMSIAGAALPLLIPAAFYGIAGVTTRRER